MISQLWYHIHKLWYHRRFTVCIYSILYHTYDIVGVDYDIIHTDLWYHSYIVTMLYHVYDIMGHYVWYHMCNDLWYHSYIVTMLYHVYDIMGHYVWYHMCNRAASAATCSMSSAATRILPYAADDTHIAVHPGDFKMIHYSRRNNGARRGIMKVAHGVDIASAHEM